MQIQSVASMPVSKLEERPAPAVVQGAPQVRAAEPEAPAAARSKEDVAVAVKKLNEAMPPSAQSLQFEIDDDSKEIVVKIIDQTTREVVRQIPTEEALEMAKSIDKMQGLLIRQTA